ncbi:DUF6412 domain-containing protein [Nocardia arthritidis]|uniref:Uncharacterized protein n=1 Tax=Nocardia arthritidis TaxID=228602 RepID=A0A6G9YJF2_9NOCA|nr:DUF6412 domain-containing protein [Nocardia arthritidis]QIS13166.1 hypothetical protein F5544_26560 [Nocardia arthritidis]
MFTRAQLTAFAIFATVLPALALFAVPDKATSLAVVGVVAAELVLALVALQTTRLVPIRVYVSGPPPSAQRRLRGSFLRQSNPDAPGRVRPRAPGRAVR